MKMKTIEGKHEAGGKRWVIVAARWNEFVTGPLVNGAADALRDHGASDDAITLVWVPGAFEVPSAVVRAIDTGIYDGVIAIAAVIRGDTPHFDYVSNEVSAGCARAATETGVPVAFGVLTCDNVEQAMERAGTKAGNKGWEAALAAMEMVSVLNQLDEEVD